MKNTIAYCFMFILLFLASCKNEGEDFSEDETNMEVDDENLDENGLPTIDFDVILPSISAVNEYTIDVDEWDIPTNGTDAIKTTANLQAAIDWAHDEGYTRVVLPEGEYLVGEESTYNYQSGIDLYENTEFVFSEGAVLEMDTNDKWNYCVLRLNGDNIICLLYTSPSPRDA